jgi:WD40 repeat protein
VLSAAFSRDGRRIVTGSQINARVWDVATAHVLFTLEVGAEVGFVAYSPQGDKVLTLAGDEPNGAYLWDGATGRKLLGPMSEANYDWASSPNLCPAAFSRDGKKLATISIKLVKIWDTATGQGIAQAQAWRPDEINSVWSVAFSPEGTRLAVGTRGFIRIFSAATGEQICPDIDEFGFEPIDFVAFTPEGRRVLGTARGKHSGMWDAKTGKRLMSLAPESSRGNPSDYDRAPVIALSPNANRLLAGWGPGNYTRMWEVP